MSRVDTAWLRMERPTNPMMITGVLMFDEPITLAALRRTVRDRFLSYARFRQKAVHGAAGWHWENDRDFDLDWHVRISGLPGRGDKRALERFASQLASSPLDPHRPMWQFHLVERYHGGSAVVARIHHCYADGIALVQVLLSMTDTERKATPKAQLARSWLKDEHHRVARRVGAVDRYMALGSKVVGGGMAMVQDPTLAAILAREGGDLAAELVRVLAMPDDPPSLLRGALGVSKRVAWAEPLDLDAVKAVSRACDCTVNDVLMATAAGALRGYIEDRGDQVDGLTIRATVPVNMRPLEHARQLGLAFQLTNFIRDVAEDLDRGRVYLPVEVPAGVGELAVRYRYDRPPAPPGAPGNVLDIETVAGIAPKIAVGFFARTDLRAGRDAELAGVRLRPVEIPGSRRAGSRRSPGW